MIQTSPAPPNQDAFTRAAADAQNPYLGLHPFEEKDAAYFFGRTQETADLFRMVKRGTLTVLFGRSGLGKSSLLRAGLFPRLRADGFFPISVRFNYESDAPLAEQFWTSIDGETATRRDGDTGLQPGESIWAWFHRVPLWSERNRLLAPILVFDQFEEAFTLGRGHPDSPGILAQLADLIENRVPAGLRSGELPATYGTPKVKVILALREDYLPQLEDLRPLIPSLAANRYRLLGMNGQQALEAVASPGEKIIDRSVAEKVVRFVASAGEGRDADAAELSSFEVEPALLSLVCRELNERRKQKNQPAISEALLSGERGRIIEGFYERSVGDLHTDVRAFVEDRLLTSDGYRTTVALSSAREAANVSDQAIETLIQRRVLRKEDRFGRPHLELIHDVLTRIVRASRDRRREEARRAEALKRKQAWLWRGLAAAVGLITLIITAIVVLRTNAARNARREEQRKQARLVAHQLEDAGREALLRGDNDNAAQLLNLGYRFLRQAEAKSRDHEMMLARALMELRGQVAIVEHPPDIGALVYTPKGNVLLTGGADGAIRVWGTDSYDEDIDPLKPSPIVQDEVDPYGNKQAGEQRAAAVEDLVAIERFRVASLAGDAVTLWDALAAKEVARLSPAAPDEPLAARPRMCASPDHLVVWYPGDTQLSVWHLAAIRPRLRPTKVPAGDGPGVTVADVACLREGKLLVGGGDGIARILRDDAVPGPQSAPQFTTLERLPHGAAAIGRVGATPDGATLATSGSDGRAVIWAREGELGRRRLVLGQLGQVASFAFTDTGDALLIVSGVRRAQQVQVQQEANIKGARRVESAAMTATLWDLASRRPVFSAGADHLDARFTPDGKRAVVVSPDKLAVWAREPRGWRQSREAALDGSNVTAVALYNDRAAIATAGGVARIWELGPPAPIGDVVLAWPSPITQPMPISVLETGARYYAVSFVGDDEHLLFLGERRIDFVDALTGLVDSRPAPDAYLEAFAVDPTRRRFVVAGNAGTVQIWDAAQKKLIKAVREPGRRVFRAAFSPDGEMLATGDDKGRICLYAAAQGRLVACQELFPGVLVSALAVRQEGATILAGDELGRAALLDLPQGTVRLLEAHTSMVWAAAFAPDGKSAITSSQDGTAAIWDVASAQRSGSIETAGWFIEIDGKGRIVIAGAGLVEVWDPSGKKLHTLPALEVKAMALGPDRTTLYTFERGATGGNNVARSWSLDDGSPLDIVAISDGGGALSPSGRLVATAGYEADIFSAPSAARDRPPGHVGGVVHAILRGPKEGAAVTLDQRGTALLWSPWGHRSPRRIGTNVPAGMPPIFSPDGGWIAVADGESAWAVSSSGAERRPLASGAWITAMAWAKDRVLLADETLAVSLVDPSGANPPRRETFATHRGQGSRATFDPSGERFAFVNGVGSIEVWTREARLFTVPVPATMVKELVLGDAASGLLVARTPHRLLLWRLPAKEGGPIGEPVVYSGTHGAVYLTHNGLVGVRRGQVHIYPLPVAKGQRRDERERDKKTERHGDRETVTIETTARIFPPDLDGQFLLGYEEGALTVWSLDNGRVLETLRPGALKNAYFNQRGDLTTYGYDDDDPKGGRIVHWVREGSSWRRDERDRLMSMGVLYALSGDKALLGRDDLDDQWPIRTIREGSRLGLILPGQMTTWLLVLDSKSDAPARYIQAPGIVDFRFDADRSRVWTLGDDASLTGWSLETLAEMEWRTPSSVAASGAGLAHARLLLVGDKRSAAQTIRLDVLTVPLDDRPVPPPLSYVHDRPITAAAFDGGAMRLVAGDEEGRVLLWDLPVEPPPGAPVAQRREGPRILLGHVGRITAVAFGPDGDFATAGMDGTARVWRRDGEHKVTLTGHLGPVRSVAFDPQGHWVVTASEDGTARVWADDDRGTPLARLSAGSGAAVRHVAFVPGGKLVVTADDDGLVRIWDLSWAVHVWEGDTAKAAEPEDIYKYLQRMLP